MSAPDSDIESYKSILTVDHYLGARATQIHTRARGAPTTLARRPVVARTRAAHARETPGPRVPGRGRSTMFLTLTLLCTHFLLAPFSSEIPTPTISYPRLSNLAIRQ